MPVGFDKFGVQSSSTGLPVSEGFPYYKYTWTANFEFADDPTTTSADITLRSFELPRWTVDTQIVNVYNHKTLVQTKLNWEPVTVSFYDQQNDAVEKLVWDFVQGQFDPNDGSKKSTIRPLKVTVKMHKFSGGELDTSNKTYILENVYIIDAQHDTLDYSTSDPVLWTISLRYENLTWEGGFEGEPGTSNAGVPSKPATPKPPGKINDTSAVPGPGKINDTPAVPDLPDASPGMLEMMDGNTGGEVNYGAVNHNPRGLARVLDEQRSREKANKKVTPPGGSSEPTYTGYEGGFVPTPPGEGAQGFSPSTGTAKSSTSEPTYTGYEGGFVPTPPDSRRVDAPTAKSTAASKTAEPSGLGREADVEGITQSSQNRNPTNRQFQNAQDELKAQQTGQTVAQVRAARARNIRALDKAVPDNSWN